MSTQNPHQRREGGLDWPQFQVVGALLLIALGIVFLAQQTGILSNSANWWVIFLAIPGLGLLWNAFTNYRQMQRVTGPQTIEWVLGAILLILTVIFVFDPTWSFTRTFGRIFPNVNWDAVWPYLLVVPGVLLLAWGLIRRWVGIVILGLGMVLVGAVFVFDIDWNYVWPLALIVPGLWLLFTGGRRLMQ